MMQLVTNLIDSLDKSKTLEPGSPFVESLIFRFSKVDEEDVAV